MTLRLKRGTDEQRLLIVFEEGELVYTTDTKKIYAGDGVTAGGVPVADVGILDNNIDLNGYDIVGTGNIDIVGTVTATEFVGDGSGLTNLLTSGEAYNISILADDSTLVFDSTTGSINGVIVNGLGATVFDPSIGSITLSEILANTNGIVLKRSSNSVGDTILEVQSNEDNSVLSLVYNSATDLSTLTSTVARISFGRNDPINGLVPITNIISNNEAFQIYHSSTIDYANSSNWLTFKNNMFGVGMFTPTHTLDINGNARIQSSLLLGNLTTTERNNLVSPQNGTMIYNTTVQRFQGFQNGGWINLDNGEAA